jgi:hypothetical protein
MDKINANKIKRRGTTPGATCKSFLTFDFKTAGATTVTFQYKECGGIVNTVTYSLPISVDFSTFDISDFYTPFCFEEGTLVRIGGLSNVNNFTYGECTEE